MNSCAVVTLFKSHCFLEASATSDAVLPVGEFCRVEELRLPTTVSCSPSEKWMQRLTADVAVLTLFMCAEAG